MNSLILKNTWVSFEYKETHKCGATFYNVCECGHTCFYYDPEKDIDRCSKCDKEYKGLLS